MDFFQHQEVAQKKTGRLVVLFALAVVAILVSVYLVIAGVLVFASAKEMTGPPERLLANPLLIAAVTIGTLAVIGLSSLYKIIQLRGGGRLVAEGLGGRLLTVTRDDTERRLLNVVEEMAIASGTPCPPVYLLDQEWGINAFAAGYTPDDAVIGVTRGCAEQLSRDELQGVIAHEFSHILNGDMRLNIRLMGLLHGILVIGMIGYFVLRMGAYGGGRRSGKSGGAVLMIGAGLAIIGFMGTFFGNWIKAAVSRQREFMADASAVQFTRNPAGIADALKRIGGWQDHATIEHPNAPQASHMFFGEAVTSGLSSIMATHPPLPDRIRRVEPGWDGKFLKGRAVASPATTEPGPREDRADRQRARAEKLALIATGAAVAATSGLEAIGRPGPEHVQRARELLAAIPASLIEATGDAYNARAVVYALLIDADETIRRAQIADLRRTDEPVAAIVAGLLPDLARLPVGSRLPLIERTVPALRELSPEQYEAFRATVDALVEADDRLGLLEWTLQRIVVRHLDGYFRGAVPRPRQVVAGGTTVACETVLSLLAYAGHRTVEDAQRAFAAAADEMQAGTRPGAKSLQMRTLEQCRLNHVDWALDTLAGIGPALKRTLVRACATCISTDGSVTATEAEVMRAVCDALGCPMPPLLPGQKLIARPTTSG